MEYSFSDSIASIATVLAPQALSIIRASGRECIPLIASVFSHPNKLIGSHGNTTHVGYIMEGNNKIDQVVVSVYKDGKSFTGEDSAEITAHGGIYTTLSIYNLLIKTGFRAAERGEFSFRAFINGKINLTQAEAIKLLSSAKSKKEVNLALSGLENVLFKKIEEIKNNTLHLMAMLDVALEYPEDEVELDGGSFGKKLQDILGDMSALLKKWGRDELFLEGVKVVIAGRANAGKSSLFNAILNKERSIVSSFAGTTRDYIEENLVFNEMPIKLYDTAGLRHTKDKIEMEGIERTKKVIEEAHIVLYLIDGTEGILGEDSSFLQNCTKNCIVVLTKKDIKKPEKDVLEKLKHLKIKDERVLSISAKKGEGVEALIDSIVALLTKTADDDVFDAALISERQKGLLEKAFEHMQCIKAKYVDFENFEYMDLMMQELQDALNALGQITGEVRVDEILENVFSSFCVGK